MQHAIPTINAFIEDTCVLTVIAYLLARGRMLELLFAERRTAQDQMRLALVLGLAGLSEVIFPGWRAPYVAHTLIVTFATLVGGPRIGTLTSVVVLIGVGVLQPESTPGAALAFAASALTAEAVRRLFGRRHALLRGLVAGVSAQAAVIALHAVARQLHTPYTLSFAALSIPANGFGVMLLQLVLNDARMRADSERHRLEAERAQTLVTEAQLVALRARVHPHFLFNTLTSIAALCGLAPERAERAIIQLSQLMRRSLEAHPSAPLALAEELEFVRGYVEIEQHRLGSRLRVTWDVDPASAAVRIPAFTVQTLVENAVTHGIAARLAPGEIHVVARARRSWTLVAVVDNGLGMTPKMRRASLDASTQREHGLQIASQQLALLYGRRARVRLFSEIDRGTVAAFLVPSSTSMDNAPVPG
jgi:LytS/YehU family sensor histidine kinase